MYKRMTYTDRLKIEALFNAKVPVKIIVQQLHFHISAIYREIKHGLYKHLNTDYTYSVKYSAYKAQQYTDFNRTGKGAQLKVGNDHKFIRFVENMILNKKYSPDAVLGYIRENKIQFNTNICRVTLYNYIDKGLFPHLTNKNLLMKGKRRKKHKIRPLKQASYGTSIEKRPSEILKRNSFGHWEMDSVIGKRKKGNTLLVFTERFTRYEIILKSKDKTALSTVKAINNLEKTFGKNTFRKIFRTITCDNGTEFSQFYHMQLSPIDGKQRTSIYYCHPYCSSERGSNENQNRFIRRFIPKSSDIENYTTADICKVQDYINSYPRRIFDYKNSQQLFECELSKLGISTINKFF